MNRIAFSLSIVSHGHKKHIARLLQDLATLTRNDFEVILTLNLPETLEIDCRQLPFPVTLIRNSIPKGFAENHNAAFAVSHGQYFVVLNPDIRLLDDPFGALLSLLQANPRAICAPLIVNAGGVVEDSARHFPTPAFLAAKLIGKLLRRRLTSDFIAVEDAISMPDWVAGMFIAVPRDVYRGLHGLDERYRLYYEDVDFCARARLAGCKILVSGHAKVIHEAQRDSHRNLRYLGWHLRSALRFFTSRAYLRIQLSRLFGASRLA